MPSLKGNSEHKCENKVGKGWNPKLESLFPTGVGSNLNVVGKKGACENTDCWAPPSEFLIP